MKKKIFLKIKEYFLKIKERLEKKYANIRRKFRRILMHYMFIPTNEYAKFQREYQRNSLKAVKAIPKFDKKECKNVILMRYASLYNYIVQFGFYLNSYYLASGFYKRFLIRNILGKERLYTILTSKKEKDFITINEIFSLFRWLNLKKDFMNYIQSKTQFSYSVIQDNDIKAVSNCLAFSSTEYAFKIKFAEFVYIILSEYIMLHNLMFASGFKINKIKTIDQWMKDINDK